MTIFSISRLGRSFVVGLASLPLLFAISGCSSGSPGTESTAAASDDESAQQSVPEGAGAALPEEGATSNDALGAEQQGSGQTVADLVVPAPTDVNSHAVMGGIGSTRDLLDPSDIVVWATMQEVLEESTHNLALSDDEKALSLDSPPMQRVARLIINEVLLNRSTTDLNEGDDFALYDLLLPIDRIPEGEQMLLFLRVPDYKAFESVPYFGNLREEYGDFLVAIDPAGWLEVEDDGTLRPYVDVGQQRSMPNIATVRADIQQTLESEPDEG